MGYEDAKYKFQISYACMQTEQSTLTLPHNSDVTWVSWRLKSPTTRLFVHFFPTDKYNLQASHHWLLWCESTGVQWFSLTKGQWCWEFPCNDVIRTAGQNGMVLRYGCLRTSQNGVCLFVNGSPVTPPPPDKMAGFSQTIFSDAFSWMKSFVFL